MSRRLRGAAERPMTSPEVSTMGSERAPRGVVEVGDGFWNIRGSYKLKGVVELGTQSSLVRLASGRYVFLDAYTLPDPVRRWVDERTDGGAAVEAILNLHPFHTLHVRGMHAQYPNARLYGTARHVERFSDLPWDEARTDDAALHARYADDLDFSVPRGVDFISSDENVHFSSVLAFHRASRTLHVDDTLLYLRMPPLVRLFKPDVLRFHPTLGKVLEPRAGAADDFRAWARELIERAGDVDNLCAAHSAALLARRNEGPSIAARIEAALANAEATLRSHDRTHEGTGSTPPTN